MTAGSDEFVITYVPRDKMVMWATSVILAYIVFEDFETSYWGAITFENTINLTMLACFPIFLFAAIRMEQKIYFHGDEIEYTWLWIKNKYLLSQTSWRLTVSNQFYVQREVICLCVDGKRLIKIYSNERNFERAKIELKKHGKLG